MSAQIFTIFDPLSNGYKLLEDSAIDCGLDLHHSKGVVHDYKAVDFELIARISKFCPPMYVRNSFAYILKMVAVVKQSSTILRR